MVSSKDQYSRVLEMLRSQHCSTNLASASNWQPKHLMMTRRYDTIASWMQGGEQNMLTASGQKASLRYGENPHQDAAFMEICLKYSIRYRVRKYLIIILVDIESAVYLMEDCGDLVSRRHLPILKHTMPAGSAGRYCLKHGRKRWQLIRYQHSAGCLLPTKR